MGVALGSLGWTEETFYASTPRAFFVAVERWSEMERMRDRSEWERTRFLAVCSMNPHLKKPLKPTDLFKFDDEKRPRVRKDVPELDPVKEARVLRKFKEMQ